MVYNKFKEYWESYGLELLAGFSLLIIIVLFIYNLTFKKENGTFTIPRRFDKGHDGSYSSGNNLRGIQHTEKDSKLELQAKFILENVFKKPFLKIRPDFLQNDVTGQNLEIDLYNDELKLGVEVNGDQHYRFIPFFHRNKEAFRNQRYRDEMKKIKCRDNGITLIEIPYKVGEKGIKNYLLNKLRLEGFLI